MPWMTRISALTNACAGQNNDPPTPTSKGGKLPLWKPVIRTC